MSEFVYYRSYSRWIDDERRRETWIETVDRYMRYMMAHPAIKDNLSIQEYDEIREAILSMQVMPSMRLMWSAGKACDATNVAAFNCAYVAPTSLKDLGDILYILACGTGVGFSVESAAIQQFPVVKRQIPSSDSSSVPVHVIEDSKEGWGDALVLGMSRWYEGQDISFDYSQLRPEGARLKTMGGRSSGPKPLVELLTYVRSVVLSSQGRRLTNLNMHDIICKIGDCIVAGGVRRSALISLSDLDDTDMRHAKAVPFWHLTHKQRELANDSAVYNIKPTAEKFLDEWLSLIKSHSGERGIFNRSGLVSQMPSRRVDLWKHLGLIVGGEVVDLVGTNPCGEITLQSRQFCNLTEVVCRVQDTVETLKQKVRVATILGTYQSTLTNYPYIDARWKVNCEKERLLGVSLTGQWDCPTVRDSKVLEELWDCTVQVNIQYAKRFGISPSMSLTCGKPSGTVSQLVDSSSGGHARYAEYYIRRIRISSSDPLLHMLRDQGVPVKPDVGMTEKDATRFVLEFPVHSPTGPYSKDLSAIDQLEHWKMLKTYFTEHNPSVTISVAENEWLIAGNWVYENWDIVGGLSFLPRDDHVYELAPYEEIDRRRYEEMCLKFKSVDYSKIMSYEQSDSTEGSREFACVSGVCEVN